MFDSFFYNINLYFAELSQFLAWHWRNMTPTKYTVLLISIGVFGWILMRRGVREY